MRTREWVAFMGAFITVLLAGCLENKLSGGELDACLSSTHTTLTHIPLCNTAEACFSEWRKSVPIQPFSSLPESTPQYLAEKGIVGSWIGLNEASLVFRELHERCAKETVSSLLSRGSVGATHLKTALKESESAFVYAFIALQLVLKKAQKEEVERVKDTKAFQSYTDGLQLVQDLKVGATSNTLSDKVKENQEYFNELGKSITTQDVEKYRIRLPSAFDFYETAIKKAYPEQAETIRMFSPIWGSLITTYREKQQVTRGIELLEKIKAGEIITHIEENVNPESGIVPWLIKKMRDLDEGILLLKEEEKQLIQEIRKRLSEIEEKKTLLVAKRGLYEKWNQELEQWKKSMGGFEKRPRVSFIEINVETWTNTLNEWEISRIRNTGPLGVRVERLRNALNQIGTLEKKISDEDLFWQHWVEDCKKTASEITSERDSVMETEESCVAFLTQAKSRAKKNSDLGRIKNEVELRACVNEIQPFARALEMDESAYTSEWFVYEFGENAAIPACQSTLAHFVSQYQSHEEVQTLLENAQKLEEYAVGFARVQGPLTKNQTVGEWEKKAKDWEKLITKAKSPLTPEEREKADERISDEIRWAEKKGMEVLNEIALRMKWVPTSNAEWIPNMEREAVWKTHLENPFGRELSLPNEIQIPTPFPIHDIESNPPASIDFDDTQIVWNQNFLPEKGIWFQAKSRQEMVHLNERFEVTSVIGSTIWATSHLDLTTKHFPINIRIEWKLPSGIKRQSILVEMENVSLPFNLINDTLQTPIAVNSNQTTVKIHYTLENQVRTHYSLIRTYEEWETPIHEYLVTISNDLSREINTGVSLGIPGNPLQVSDYEAFDEEGKEIETELNDSLGLVGRKIWLPALGERKITVRLAMNPFAENWKIISQTIHQQLYELMQNENDEIRVRALALNEKLQELLKQGEKVIAEKIPTILSRVEALKGDSEALIFSWESAQQKWRAIQEKLVGENVSENERIVRLVKIGKNFLAQKNRMGLEKTMFELETIIEKEEQKEDTPVLEEIKKEESTILFLLQDALQITETALESISKYEKNNSLSCQKLLEAGFVCPIPDAEKKELKSDLAKNKRDLEKWIKKIEKNNEDETVKEQLENGKVDQAKEMAQRANEQFTDATRVLEEAANRLVEELHEMTNALSSPQIKQSVEKAEGALHQDEWGKAIYIAKNVLAHEKRKNVLTGLSTLTEAWPLVGLGILMIGGFWYYRRNKQRKKEPIPLQRVPRINEASLENSVSAFEAEPPPRKLGFPPPVSKTKGKKMPPQT